MAVFDFSLPVYGFDQFSSGAATNNTVGYAVGTSFSLDANAVFETLEIQDDDGNAAGSGGNTFDDGFIDPTGNGSNSSTANNDQVLTDPITINNQTFQSGDQVELEFGFTTTAGDTFWIIRIDGVNVGISGPVLPVPGTSYTVQSSGDGQAIPIEDIPCFVDGAMVVTPDGPLAIEKLRAGDLVCTVDHGPQRIKWAGKWPTTELEMAFFPQLRPIKIAKGALGPGVPDADLIVSPQHRIAIASPFSALYFATAEVFVTAKSLVNGTTIVPAIGTVPTYRHLLFDRHEVLTVNGTAVESLYPQAPHVPYHMMLEHDLFGQADADVAKLARPMLRHFEGVVLAAV